MLVTWMESSAKGRLGGPVRAGMWSAAVVGTNPIQANQSVWLELLADDVSLGPLPAYWIENKGVNSLWHVPIPPQAIGTRLHYRAVAEREGEPTATSPYQDTIVRPNLPDRTEATEVVTPAPEGLVGNRMMTVRIDPRGATYDIYFPTVGLHSDVRPAEGDLPRSRANFRAIVGGLALGRRLDWFSERLSWETAQHYLDPTNLLVTELTWRNGPVKVHVTDLVVMGNGLPRTAGGTDAPGQYIKRFRVRNEGTEPRRALFGVYIQAEVNGGLGEPGLSWHDQDRTLLAVNRGHGHANRKLARDATIEFAVALDGRGDVHCEPTGANEAMLLRWLELPAGETVTVDLLVSGAFTGWKGDPGTFEHWLRPALAWFRASDLDEIEKTSAAEWVNFVERLPNLQFPRPNYAVTFHRSALAAALHADAQWGAIASGFDRGLSAYCWPRDSLWAGGMFERLGHRAIGRGVLQWLANVRGQNQNRQYAYWFQKYTIDGSAEWETPAVDQTAMIPWAVERHYRRTDDLDFVVALWPMIEQAATVACGASGHPGLRFLDDVSLVSSAGVWDSRFGAFLYSNAAVVAGLRASARLARILDKPGPAEKWQARADRIWEQGILGTAPLNGEKGPGLVDPLSGRFLDARRLSTLRGLWTDNPAFLLDRSPGLDVSQLGVAVPFGLIPAADPRIGRTAEALLRNNVVGDDLYLLARWSSKGSQGRPDIAPGESHSQDVSSLATLWMVRYLIQLGRETGRGQPLTRALVMLDSVLGRLLPLGLAMRAGPRAGEATRSPLGMVSGVWYLHTMLIDTLLDFAGVEYDAVDRRLILDPVLPGAWPQTGLSQALDCGDVSYRLERPIGGTVHRLTLKTHLRHQVLLQTGVTCSGLTSIGEWQASPDTPPPDFDRRSGRLTWTLTLPAGESSWTWTWG